MPDKVILDMMLIAKIAETLSCGYHNGSSFIAILPSSAFETAIAWFVVTIWVYAIQRQFVGVTVGHSPIAKWFKSVPRLINSDSATTIVFKHYARGIVAAIPHSVPSKVKAAFAHAMGTVVGTGCFMSAINLSKGSLDSQTATGIRLSLGKSVRLSPDNLAAGTFAKPFSLETSEISVSHLAIRTGDGEVPEYLVG